MSNPVNQPTSDGVGPKGEVHPLFPDQAAGPFRSTTDEQNDIRFLKRYGPKAEPLDMTKFSEINAAPRSSSALSAPDNFIAEGYLRRTIHRHRWLFAGTIVTLVALVAAAIYGMGLIPSRLDSRSEPRASARVPDEQVEARAPAEARSAPAPSAEATSAASGEKRQPGQSMLVAPRSADLQKRLATSGLPEQPSDPLMPAEAKVTAFPPESPASSVDREKQSDAVQQPVATLPTERPEPQGSADTKPVPPRPERDVGKLDALVARGEQLLASGEIAAARLFFGRSAAEGDPRGARGLAKTYDVNILKGLAVRGIDGNRAEAERWYLKAAELEADQAKTNGRQAR
ncbi:SEL1-like repeat protein [Methylobacterium planeticum]|uniref:Sel1 repeat family protein n=1 Tax=Methylobacterium planeticum TaxID=2615211 RepID=A0A6N6MKD7_9HYPH|nr:hypothetical protein [Methylobacterium planeticum]KAB1070110.1 hypothetical protein F6X51_23830 [Methylobacterium planeticum]